MATDRIGRIERMLNRSLTAPEKERLGRIQKTLGMADNDALWDVITALEYQRTFYDDLPRKIGSTAQEIMAGIATAAEKEAAAAQARLTDSVVKQAKRLSEKINYATLMPLGVTVVVIMMLFGCLLLWAGYCLGVRQMHDIYWMLRMPSGLVTGCLAFVGGMIIGFISAREYAYEEKLLWKHWVVSLILMVAGVMLIVLTL